MTGAEENVAQKRCMQRFASRNMAVAVWIVTLLLLIHALYLGKALLMPITLSLLAYLAMRPIVVRMRRHRVPAWLAAGLVTCLFGGLVVAIFSLVSEPAQYWAMRVPQRVHKIAEQLESFKRPLEVFNSAEEQIEKLTETERVDAPLKVEVTSPSLVDREVLFSSTGQVLSLLFAISITSFFLLASDDDLLRRLMRTLPTLTDRKKALSIVLDLQDLVGAYLAQITMINFGLGCAVALMTWSVGMPTPLLWGVMAMLLNYIPFVGALVGAVVIFLAAAVEFDQVAWAVATTTFYLALTGIEANFITPMVLGKTMKVGPVMVLLAVAFWGFLWGLSGIIVAVPMLIVLRLISSSFPATKPIAILLGEEVTVEEVSEETSVSTAAA